MFAFLVQGRDIVKVDQDAIHSGPYEAGGPHLLEHMQVLALAVPHHRGQQHQLAALGLCQHGIDHLADGLCLQCDAVVRAAWVAHPGEQQAQVVVNLRDGAHRRAGVMGSRFLFD